ncbi:hypothetical protein PaecuDRAFT_1107 [Paenibacillus curdlanolyticus YK9]|uniref:DUF3895 domain-containing protein n=1 Tax=Paenibacillus curdlanolyticus YK9 TaxID=717606 RepID=E0I635_9BACL|nr:hypothetical protein [Paenibacillus curdlanolyticus]EFM12427.1 hypothetical protein PaecuDRAFT_1107 [Paenibacillus curdlanolyticus YK9]
MGKLILAVEDRDRLVQTLSEQQQQYISESLIRGRRTVFANEMAKQKGFHIPEDTDAAQIELLLNDWIYTGYVDAGMVSPDLRCECGRPLRYQHRVEHKETGEVKHFGIEHLKEHLAIDSSVVSAIKKGFEAIDYELDELLIKRNSGWTQDPELLQMERLPDDVADHLRLGLPLLERQINRLRQIRAAAQSVRSTPKVEPRPIAAPVKAVEAPMDLFAWQDAVEEHQNQQKQQKQQEPPLWELPYALQEPTQRYLRGGMKSARIICELLISEHGGSDLRFLTGKPRLYLSVCSYIESLDGVRPETVGPEDRTYAIQQPASK